MLFIWPFRILLIWRGILDYDIRKNHTLINDWLKRSLFLLHTMFYITWFYMLIVSLCPGIAAIYSIESLDKQIFSVSLVLYLSSLGVLCFSFTQDYPLLSFFFKDRVLFCSQAGTSLFSLGLALNFQCSYLVSSLLG